MDIRARLRKEPGLSLYAALVAVQVFFGVHYLAAKVVLREIPPPAWATIRVAVSAAILLAYAAWKRKLPRGRREIGELALYAIFGVVINQICFIEGLSRTTATHSAILNTMIPVGTLAFAILLGREAFTAAKGGSLALAFAGVMLVVRPDRAAFSPQTLAGDLLTLVNGLSYAFFLVISKRVLRRVDAVGATATLLLFGSVGIGLYGWRDVAALDFASVSATAWWTGAFIVIFPTVAAYFLIYWALARAESSTVALYVYLQPVIAGALSAVFLGERVGATTLLGAALIFAAVAFATRGSGQGEPAKQLDPAG